MKFTVIWSHRAENELATIWTSAGNRRGVTQAARALDRLLSRDPLNCGESRDRKKRILLEKPLSVIYQVDRRRRQVVVISVARTSRPI